MKNVDGLVVEFISEEGLIFITVFNEKFNTFDLIEHRAAPDKEWHLMEKPLTYPSNYFNGWERIDHGIMQ
jgi:hypothetical protein